MSYQTTYKELKHVRFVIGVMDLGFQIPIRNCKLFVSALILFCPWRYQTTYKELKPRTLFSTKKM